MSGKRIAAMRETRASPVSRDRSKGTRRVDVVDDDVVSVGVDEAFTAKLVEDRAGRLTCREDIPDSQLDALEAYGLQIQPESSAASTPIGTT